MNKEKNKRDSRSEGDRRSSSQLALMWRKYKRNRLAKIGTVVFGLLLLVVIFAPFFSPYNYKDQQLSSCYIPPQKVHFVDQEGNFHLRPFTYAYQQELDPITYKRVFTEDKSKRYPVRFFSHGWEYELLGLIKSDLHLFTVAEGGTIYLLGTDGQGRDLLSRIIQGGRISLMVAILGALVSALVGSLIGGLSGYYAGVLDMILQRIVEIIQSFPKLAIWMTLSTAIPPQWPPEFVLYGVMAIFALTWWPMLAREVRGKVLSYREEDFVMAAKALGANDFRVILRHIIPHSLSHIIVVLTTTIPMFILAESMLSFLGLGIQPPLVSWGVLLQKAQDFQTLGQHPWIMLPGVFIIITVLCINFVGDGLRDAADPFSQ